MVSVFFAFIINGDPTVKQFGVGMGVAVAVDATLVRCLLVPAVMVLLGRANWWFPRWLDRIVPNFSIEGEEWFRARDAAAAGAAARPHPSPSPRQRRWPRRPLHADPADVSRSYRSRALAVLATSAQASAPGWSTPHTVTPYRIGTYAAGANGQARAAVRQRRRADDDRADSRHQVRRDAGLGGGDQRRRPRDSTCPGLSVNASGRLVAAWTLDTEGTAPIGLAATLGSRSSLPRTASVLQTDGQSVSDVATAVDASGNGVVAWIESPQGAPGPATVKAATLRPGQAPQVATLDTGENASLAYLSLGLDNAGRPIVTLGREPRRRDRGADRRRPWRRHGRVRPGVRGADRDGGDQHAADVRDGERRDGRVLGRRHPAQRPAACEDDAGRPGRRTSSASRR